MGDLIAWIKGLWGGKKSAPTVAELRPLARDALQETGASEHLKQMLAAPDAEERERLHAEWEKRMTGQRTSSIPAR